MQYPEGPHHKGRVYSYNQLVFLLFLLFLVWVKWASSGIQLSLFNNNVPTHLRPDPSNETCALLRPQPLASAGDHPGTAGTSSSTPLGVRTLLSLRALAGSPFEIRVVDVFRDIHMRVTTETSLGIDSDETLKKPASVSKQLAKVPT